MSQPIVPPIAVGVPPAAVTPVSAPPAMAPAVAQPAPVPVAAAPAAQATQAQAPQAGTAPTPESPQPAATGPAAVPTDKLIEAYIALRDDKERIQAAHKQELKQHNDMMEKIAGELDSRLVRDGAKTFSVDAGSATRVITTNAVCNDWHAFEQWVIENRRFDVFPKKLNYTPFKEMAENDQPLPPGVRLEHSARVQVRRKS